jgi:hypothetical protein
MLRLDTVETHSITALRWIEERDIGPKGEAHIRPDPRVTFIMVAPSESRRRVLGGPRQLCGMSAVPGRGCTDQSLIRQQNA